MIPEWVYALPSFVASLVVAGMLVWCSRRIAGVKPQASRLVLAAGLCQTTLVVLQFVWTYVVPPSQTTWSPLVSQAGSNPLANYAFLLQLGRVWIMALPACAAMLLAAYAVLESPERRQES